MLTPEEIKTLREYTEMTQVQMAQLFRVRPSDVIAWENGDLQPDERTAREFGASARLGRQESAFQIQLISRPGVHNARDILARAHLTNANASLYA